MICPIGGLFPYGEESFLISRAYSSVPPAPSLVNTDKPISYTQTNWRCWIVWREGDVDGKDLLYTVVSKELEDTAVSLWSSYILDSIAP